MPGGGPIYAGPGVVHWHGAAPDEHLVQLIVAARHRSAPNQPCGSPRRLLRRSLLYRQRELHGIHKSFIINDLLYVCQPRFPRSFLYSQRESSGLSEPFVDESGATPRWSRPWLVGFRPAAGGPVHPAGRMETRGPSVPDRPRRCSALPTPLWTRRRGPRDAQASSSSISINRTERV